MMMHDARSFPCSISRLIPPSFSLSNSWAQASPFWIANRTRG